MDEKNMKVKEEFAEQLTINVLEENVFRLSRRRLSSIRVPTKWALETIIRNIVMIDFNHGYDIILKSNF